MIETVDIRSEVTTQWHPYRAWGWFVALGLGMALLGLLAATNLAVATVATMFYISVMMLFAGSLQIVQAFMIRQWRWFVFWLIGGLIYLAAGAAILVDPLLAATLMTIALAVLIGCSGLLLLWIALNERANGRVWLGVSGIARIGAAAVIAAGWPTNAIWVLGLVLSVDLLVQGTALTLFGLALKSAL